MSEVSNISIKDVQQYCQENPAQCKVEINIPQETPKIASDKNEVQNTVKKGLIPTGKGLLGGAVAGGASSAALAAGLSYKMMGLFGDLTVGSAAVSGGIIGGFVGGVSGAITANITDNKAHAAIVGGIVGGVATMCFGTGFLIGTVAGAAGAAAGAYLAEKK